MTESRIFPEFTPDCTKKETIWGWIYLPIHVILLPILLPVLQLYVFPNLTAVQANALYYGTSLAVVAILFHTMLRREFDHLLDRPLRCLSSFFSGYFLWYLLSLLVTALLMALGMTEDPPNDLAVDQLALQSRNITMVISVIAAPILEEVLFRGVLFQSLRKQSRLLAYLASLLVFGLYHVWQFAVMEQDWTYLLYVVQYLPITFAITWSYERSGSLWTAIFFHASNNYIALRLLETL